MAGDVAEERHDSPAADAGRGSSGGVSGVVWWALVELFVVAGFVIAQPLLDVTGKAPDFFLLHRASGPQILLLVAVIVVLPPLGLWLGELAVGLLAGPRGRRLAHLLVLAGLLSVLSLEVAKKLTPLRGKRLALAAVVVGVAATVGYARWSVVRLWLRYLAPAPLVFVLVFALLSPTSKLILPAGDGAGAKVPVRTGSGPLPPVVMVVFDEFPLKSLLDSSGQIDRRVYPRFAELAGQATWYRNATGIGGWTPYAVPSMLDGRWPGDDLKTAAPNLSAWPDNLFTMFGRYYNLKAWETITQLCPARRCGQTASASSFGEVAKETAKLYKQIASPLDAAVDPATVGQDPNLAAGNSDKSKGPTAYFGNLRFDQVNRANQFMSSIRAGDPQPTLYFLHLLLPHSPWKYLPDGRVYNSSSLPNSVLAGGIWPTPVQQLNHERHLLQVAYTDKVIGRVIDRLKQQGLWDKSLVVMTADHGEGFTAGDRARLLGPNNASDLMWVPTFVKAPHQTQGRVDDRNWEHVDLLPTMADLAGLSIPWKVDGASQTGPPTRTETDKPFYNHPGDRLVRPGPANFKQVLRGVTDTLARASQHGERGFYQFGPTADWIYKAPQQIGPVGGSPVRVRINDWGLFKDIDPESAAVPSLVVGEVTSDAPPPGATMVVAVNGRIGAAGSFFPIKPGAAPVSFAGLVPDFLFKAGDGQPQLQLYLATRAGAGYRLQPVTIEGAT